MRFKDKIVLITGSGRGIGRATAIAFAQEGASVVVNYVKEAKSADAVVEQIRSLGRDVVAIQADVSNEADVQRLIKKSVERFGAIDVLVNNAGIVFDLPILEKTVEQWERTLRVNLIGTFLCTKYAVPNMKNRKGASILNISSTNGIDPSSPESADYDTSKAGVISLTRNFAQSLAPDIRVNTIAPGWIDTEINKDLPKEFIKSETEKIALKRWGQPEEIAKVILFLCSEDASFITGSTLVVDGGYQ
ncbi:MAG: glucose 1-dehydrogenase [Candidatus Omnitrophota bacterium]|nr:glucose 1-dehydrogenase [Candidatus Omnitrophota bacterium]